MVRQQPRSHPRLVLHVGQEGRGAQPVPKRLCPRGLQAHASFFPFWEIQRILLFLASAQPLTDITEIRARNMLRPLPSCQRGPAALSAAHLNTAAGSRSWGGAQDAATCWALKSAPASRATCFSLDFNSC